MESAPNRALAAALARKLRVARNELTWRWLDRIASRTTLEPSRIFPSEDLLDHMPMLVEGIADYLENPADDIVADSAVIDKAMELGALRHRQGFGAHEILKEYEILGGILFSFLSHAAQETDAPHTPADLMGCAHRLFRAVVVIQRTTTAQYLALADEQVREREEQLRSFNRMLSHELKNRIGAVSGAAQMLRDDWGRADPSRVERFLQIVLSNSEAMDAVLRDLLSLSRTDLDPRGQRHVRLPESVQEVVRQLRDFAHDRGVTIRVAPDLPSVEVNASAVELCLINLISNAIKYSDPAADESWVEVSGEVDASMDPPQLVVAVRDNGIGIPVEVRGQLFQRFFRAGNASDRGVEGTGLGLSIVRETVEALGGRVWAQFDSPPGTTFKMAFPLRRPAPELHPDLD